GMQRGVLLVDEPSAGLNETETATLGALLREVAGSGLAVLLVEHDMSFVMGTCERIHVLDFGRIISVGTPADVQSDDTVRAAYLGQAEEHERKAPAAAMSHDGDGAAEAGAPALERARSPAGDRPVDGRHRGRPTSAKGTGVALVEPTAA